MNSDTIIEIQRTSIANDGIIKFTGKTPLHQVLRSAVLRETRAPVMRWKFNDQHHTINYMCVCVRLRSMRSSP